MLSQPDLLHDNLVQEHRETVPDPEVSSEFQL